MAMARRYGIMVWLTVVVAMALSAHARPLGTAWSMQQLQLSVVRSADQLTHEFAVSTANINSY